MEPLDCIVIGAGHAGIHAVKEIRNQALRGEIERPVRLLLIDKNPHHLRKVLLFKPAVTDEEIRIPLSRLFPDGVEIVQGAVTGILAEEKKIRFADASGAERTRNYDILVVAAGSTVRRPEPRQGGLPLASLQDAIAIRERWRTNLKQAAAEADPLERSRLMTIAVAGAGISGIETSAELAYHARQDAKRLGLDPNDLKIVLYNANERLFPQGPEKVAARLEQILTNGGVVVKHGCRVLQEADGVLHLSKGEPLPVGLCVWTLGLAPNAIVGQWGLPLTEDGFVNVDASYRVPGYPGVYSIGDCAKVIDPRTGLADGMTCKEAQPQAVRLGKVIAADLSGSQAPVHSGYMEAFCIGLGPEKGLAWVRKWGLDFVIAGKPGLRIKQYVWNLASMIK